MNSLYAQQQTLLADKIRTLRRIHTGLAWSLERLPPPEATIVEDPTVAERIAAIVDRFCKLQDQLAGAMRHAHAMLGERQRNFHDVVTWAVTECILPNESAWLELRSLRNRLTHEYDLAGDEIPELMRLVRQSSNTLASAMQRFAEVCAARGLTGST